MTDKKIWKQNELTCKPLDNYEEILMFLQDPPPWRTLCNQYKTHSNNIIKNSHINKMFSETLLESPIPFCHFDTDTGDGDIKREDKNKLPKTIVCHDMANGYHDDSIIDGTGNYDAYTFYNWAGIDIFIYFSHHLITIPTLGWINTGHAHGVKVLGTVITEWAEGVEFWDRALQSDVSWQTLASALVAIAKTLKFDGWLLNIENKVSKPDVLLQFVSHLHTTLHQELVDPVLIWYDSVTIDGHLNWQNGLNEKNKAFFNVVDGFFTNYSWSESDVDSSVEAAGDRLTDLYIGIDVWGRNFYGGGQFNTQEAVQLVYSYGCSLAIFAPAWTHEAMSDNGDSNTVAQADDLSKYEQFLLRDRALWCSLWPYLNTKVPCELPIKTSFCRGQGLKRRLYGEVISPTPWFNLRHMQYQPNSALGPHGYLLSTMDAIMGLSRLGLLKSKEGILRYRRTIAESRAELPKVTNTDTTSTPQSDELMSLFHNEIDIACTSETNENEPGTVKRKIKQGLSTLFRTKAAATDQEAIPLDAEEESTSTKKMSGPSMVRMSINLRLGNKPDKIRYGLGYVPDELECFEPFFEDSFIGGSCLKINPSDEICQEHRTSRLFFCEFFIKNPLIVCVVTKVMPGHEDQFLNIQIILTDKNGHRSKAVLVGHNVPLLHEGTADAATSELIYAYPLQEGEPDFRELQKYLLLNESDFYVPVENSFNWRVRYYEVDISKVCIRTINCRTGIDEGPILLGHLALCEKRSATASAS